MSLFAGLCCLRLLVVLVVWDILLVLDDGFFVSRFGGGKVGLNVFGVGLVVARFWVYGIVLCSLCI